MDLDKAYKLIVEKLSLWVNDIIRLLPNIVLAALVIAIGFLIAPSISY